MGMSSGVYGNDARSLEIMQPRRAIDHDRDDHSGAEAGAGGRAAAGDGRGDAAAGSSTTAATRVLEASPSACWQMPDLRSCNASHVRDNGAWRSDKRRDKRRRMAWKARWRATKAQQNAPKGRRSH